MVVVFFSAFSFSQTKPAISNFVSFLFLVQQQDPQKTARMACIRRAVGLIDQLDLGKWEVFGNSGENPPPER